MSSLRDNFRRDSEKEPQQLEREIDATRAHMAHTLDLLERKLSPGELIDEVLHLARNSGGRFAGNLTSQVQNNPLPTLITGIGLAWLMASSDRPPPQHDDTSHTAQRSVDAVHGAAERARRSAGEIGEATQELGQRARETAAGASRHLHGMADSLRGGASNTGQAARRGMRSARDQYQQLLHEQPLLLGGLGLALGAALGALAPRTDAEDELFGEHSDRVKRDVEEQGQRQYAQARDTAERAADAVQDQLTGDASPPGAGHTR